jgi:hypothetical protein
MSARISGPLSVEDIEERIRRRVGELSPDGARYVRSLAEEAYKRQQLIIGLLQEMPRRPPPPEGGK